MQFGNSIAPQGWQQLSLEDICLKITSGGTPNRKNPDFYNNGEILWVKTKELNNYFIYDSEEKITKDALNKSSAKLLPKDTILLAMYGATVGELGILSKEMACNQACCALIINPKIADFRFVFYLLKLYKENIKGLATGAAQQNLSATTIKGFTFNFPSLVEQQRIADFLFGIDDKIQLNTQTNQTLEQIAQTIYKSWFVDYEPTRAKAAVLAAGGSMADAESAAMTTISGKNAAELAAHKQEHPARYQQLADLAAAFPSALVPADDFGEIPVGWEVKPLPEIIDFMEGPGIRNWQYTDAEDGVRFINIRCIQNGDIVLDKANKITKEEAFGKYAHFQLREDDIVVSASGTLGRFAFIRKEHLPLCLNTSVIRFRPIKQKSTIGFIEGFIAGQLQYELETRASGSAQRNFGPMHLKQISIVTPGYELLSLHQDYISSLYCKRKFTLAENDNLVHIRDILLPQLLKGDV